MCHLYLEGLGLQMFIQGENFHGEMNRPGADMGHTNMLNKEGVSTSQED